MLFINPKMIHFSAFFYVFFLFCSSANGFQFSRELKPQHTPQFYIDQSLNYFDSLDSFVKNRIQPVYSSHVIRWEWSPWLFLTGHKDHWMKLDRLLLLYPTKVINRDCRAFEVQPFARCRITFHYLHGNAFYDIYEEFTFNDAGEITFVEAWSDEEGFLPMDPEKDFWAEGDAVSRLSTRVPGLGSWNGQYNRKGIRELARGKNGDPDLKNLLKRLRFPVFYWTYEAIRFSLKPHSAIPESRSESWGQSHCLQLQSLNEIHLNEWLKPCKMSVKKFIFFI